MGSGFLTRSSHRIVTWHMTIQARNSAPASHAAALAREPVRWSLREADARDREGILMLREAVFAVEDPEKRDPRFWSWEFMESPEGKARLFVAEDGDRIVGHYAVIPQDFAFLDERVKGSIVVDVMTHPDYRFQGMFKMIGRYSLRQAADGIVFATGYPIRKEVMPGHLSIGWMEQLKIPVMVRPLSWQAIARRFRLPFDGLLELGASPWRALRRWTAPALLSGESVRDLSAADAEALARVAATGMPPQTIHRVRSAALFRWRYFDSPCWTYHVVGAYRGDDLRAYVVTRHAMLLDTPSLAVVDLGAAPDADRELGVLLHRAVADATAAGLALAGAMITRGNRYHRALRRAGFHPGPHRFSLILYALQGAFHARLSDRDNNWFLTWGDTDDV